MEKQLIAQLHHGFENVAQREDGVEYWYARELQSLLGYNEWRNFVLVIKKAIQACENSGYAMTDHFVDVNKMVSLGSGGRREVDDVKLARYARYLIAQNGDPRKTEIAFAQKKRTIAVGHLAGRMVIVGYVKRGNTKHIFSMRKTNAREAKKYQKQFEEG